MTTLQLELSQEKTLITHASEKHASFLGYKVRIFREANLEKML